MGSWNSTCAISGLHITYGQEVVWLLLGERKGEKNRSVYHTCYAPLYGRYNDYGSVQDCHGDMLPIVISELKKQLVEFDLGENKFHDIEVKVDDFDTEMLFNADHERRLLIYKTDRECRIDSMVYNRLATPRDNRIPITHIQIHKDIFDSVMSDYYYRQYVGDGNGTTGYNNCYNHIYFKDVIADVPFLVTYLQQPVDKELRHYHNRYIYNFDRNLASVQLRDLEYRTDSETIIYVPELIDEYTAKGDWSTVTKIIENALIVLWLESFMYSIRREWVPTTNKGSQANGHIGYRILAKSITDVLDKERDGFDEDDE
jgi:hypothetical protein